MILPMSITRHSRPSLRMEARAFNRTSNSPQLSPIRTSTATPTTLGWATTPATPGTARTTLWPHGWTAAMASICKKWSAASACIELRDKLFDNRHFGEEHSNEDQRRESTPDVLTL